MSGRYEPDRCPACGLESVPAVRGAERACRSCGAITVPRPLRWEVPVPDGVSSFDLTMALVGSLTRNHGARVSEYAMDAGAGSITLALPVSLEDRLEHAIARAEQAKNLTYLLADRTATLLEAAAMERTRLEDLLGDARVLSSSVEVGRHLLERRRSGLPVTAGAVTGALRPGIARDRDPAAHSTG